MRFKKLFTVAAALCSLMLCASVLWADASPTPTEKTIPREVKIGKRVAEAVEDNIPRVLDPDREAKLNMLLRELTPHLERSLDYNVRILAMKYPNAFALPGGRIYITTKMLDFLKSEDELAALFAHELIHADRAHGIVQAARSQKLSLLTIAGIIAAAGGMPQALALTGAIQTAAINSYSIDLEKEADSKGIDLMKRAGFNPVAMLTMMERLDYERLRTPQVELGIYETHPEVRERIEAAKRYLTDNGIEVRRKEVLGILNVEIEDLWGDLRLSIDSTELMSISDEHENREFLEELKEQLELNLELETSPHDIQVQNSTEGRTLIIRGKNILDESYMTDEMPDIESVRDAIVDALTAAKRSNPLADYYQ